MDIVGAGVGLRQGAAGPRIGALFGRKFLGPSTGHTRIERMPKGMRNHGNHRGIAILIVDLRERLRVVHQLPGCAAGDQKQPRRGRIAQQCKLGAIEIGRAHV